MNYECINVDQWIKLDVPTKGSREKQWVLKPLMDPHTNVELYLFKESNKRYPAEFWAEIVAAEIGKLVGVQTPETLCAHMDDKYAALVRLFLTIEWDDKYQRYQRIETLSEGGDLIMGIDPAFDRKVGERHNIFLVEKIFCQFKREDLLEQFFKMLIFDAIIGNTDRHQDNWGFIHNNKTKEMALAPAYDNSTSLGSELIEEKLSGYLEENGLRLRQYIYKGKAHIRWSDNGIDLERINHFQLLKNLAGIKSTITGYVQEMTSFPDDMVDDVLKNMAKIEIGNPKYSLSDTRRTLMKNIICMRRDLLRQEFQL